MAKPQSGRLTKKDIKYFRRCHICGSLNETKDEHVQRCTHCNKPFAKFQYYDDKYTPIFSDCQPLPEYREGEYIPIRGLTVYWGNF